MKLTNEEKRILNVVENGKWKTTAKKAFLAKYRQAARQMGKREFREIFDELRDVQALKAVASGRKSIQRGGRGVSVQKLFTKIKPNSNKRISKKTQPLLGLGCRPLDDEIPR